MRISEFIKELKELQKKHGDVPILVQEDGFGGRAVFFANDIQTEEIYQSDILEASLSKEEIQEFSDKNEDLEKLETPETSFCVCIRRGSLIYST